MHLFSGSQVVRELPYSYLDLATNALVVYAAKTERFVMLSVPKRNNDYTGVFLFLSK